MYLCLSHICRSMARNQGYRLVAVSLGDFSNNGPHRPNNPLPQSHCSPIRYTVYLRCGFFLAILDWLPAGHSWSSCNGWGPRVDRTKGTGSFPMYQPITLIVHPSIINRLSIGRTYIGRESTGIPNSEGHVLGRLISTDNWPVRLFGHLSITDRFLSSIHRCKIDVWQM